MVNLFKGRLGTVESSSTVSIAPQGGATDPVAQRSQPTSSAVNRSEPPKVSGFRALVSKLGLAGPREQAAAAKDPITDKGAALRRTTTLSRASSVLPKHGTMFRASNVRKEREAVAGAPEQAAARAEAAVQRARSRGNSSASAAKPSTGVVDANMAAALRGDSEVKGAPTAIQEIRRIAGSFNVTGAELSHKQREQALVEALGQGDPAFNAPVSAKTLMPLRTLAVDPTPVAFFEVGSESASSVAAPLSILTRYVQLLRMQALVQPDTDAIAVVAPEVFAASCGRPLSLEERRSISEMVVTHEQIVSFLRDTCGAKLQLIVDGSLTGSVNPTVVQRGEELRHLPPVLRNMALLTAALDTERGPILTVGHTGHESIEQLRDTCSGRTQVDRSRYSLCGLATNEVLGQIAPQCVIPAAFWKGDVVTTTGQQTHPDYVVMRPGSADRLAATGGRILLHGVGGMLPVEHAKRQLGDLSDLLTLSELMSGVEARKKLLATMRQLEMMGVCAPLPQDLQRTMTAAAQIARELAYEVRAEISSGAARKVRNLEAQAQQAARVFGNMMVEAFLMQYEEVLSRMRPHLRHLDHAFVDSSATPSQDLTLSSDVDGAELLDEERKIA